jgi:hypothetical protein
VIRPLPLVTEAAVAAARQWKFAPTSMEGTAAWITVTVTVPFPPVLRTPQINPQAAGQWEFDVGSHMTLVAPAAVSVVDLEVLKGETWIWAPLASATEVAGLIRFDQPITNGSRKGTRQTARLRLLLTGVDAGAVEKTFAVFGEGVVQDADRPEVSYPCEADCRERIARLLAR